MVHLVLLYLVKLSTFLFQSQISFFYLFQTKPGKPFSGKEYAPELQGSGTFQAF
jgi:hypothetical protein